MSGLLRGFLHLLGHDGGERAGAVLDGLKARYHTYRVLLAGNERALELISSIDATARGGDVAAGLSESVEELLDIAYELIDGLNRLTGNGHAGLYAIYDRLSGAARANLAATAQAEAAVPLAVYLDEMDAAQAARCGGKAAMLSVLGRAGAPVPDGCAFTARACRHFLESAGLDAHIRRAMRPIEHGGGDVASVAAGIGERIMAASLPPDLAEALDRAWVRLSASSGAVCARSSALVEDKAEHSFAGQFSSVLNIRSAVGLAEAYKRVVASNFGERPINYRRHAGLPPFDFDMAVLCQPLVPARAAGIMFTVDPARPDSGRMLVTAVPGLGTRAVGGDVPADIYRPDREGGDATFADMRAVIAAKTERDAPLPEGGLRLEEVPEAERGTPVLYLGEVASLGRWGRIIESLAGTPQDIEWAVTAEGEIVFLQSRPIRLPGLARRGTELARGRVLVSGGACASPGRVVGRACPAASGQALKTLREDRTGHDGPRILLLHQSMVDAAPLLPDFDGVVVDLGNPADHLSCVAREFGIPMLTGAVDALARVQDGQWLVLDADNGGLAEAPAEALSALEAFHGAPRCRLRPKPRLRSPELAALRGLVVPLNLTDAYGPTFSIQECASVHDIVRYTHEMAVLAMFEAGDEVLEDADSLLHRLDDGVPLHFLIIDLGGGLAPDKPRLKLRRADILSAPLRALCEGMATPGLRWRKPPPAPDLGGLMSRAMLDKRSARPLGNMNYAMITRDYLNLNAREDFHFVVVDAVCGPSPAENYIRFRFKGGGTARAQRERRVEFLAAILSAEGFFTDARGDLVTGYLAEPTPELAQVKMVMLGRLIGFSRLLDSSMTGEDAVTRIIAAFQAGDWGLDSLD